MADEIVQGKKNIYDSNSEYNALDFFVKMKQAKISTAIPVKVVAVYAGGIGTTGYVDVLPLVTYVDGQGHAVQPVTLYHLPYFRLQGGNVAVITDPIVGDIGVAIFMHYDSSNVVVGTTEPQPPASFRQHSLSDGYYIGGFLNKVPTCYLELTQNQTAKVYAPNGVSIVGDVTVEGKITASGDVIGNGHSLSNHTHTAPHGETSSANG